MALLSCLRCFTRFAVGLERCPQCSSEDFEEADVPKITAAGASFPEAAAAAVEPEAGAPAAEDAPEAPEAPEAPAPVKAAPSLSRTVVQVSDGDSASAAETVEAPKGNS